MQTTRHLSTLAAALLVSAAGFSTNAAAQGYVGASVGQATVDVDCAGTTTCDRNDTAYKVFGGYMFTPNLGVEAAYYNQGKVKQAGSDPQLGNFTAEFRGDGFGVFGVVAAPFGDWSAFAKVGAVSIDVKADVTSTLLGNGNASERNTNVGWGIGGEYKFMKNLAARLEFERVRVKFQGETNNADFVTVGLSYRF